MFNKLQYLDKFDNISSPYIAWTCPIQFYAARVTVSRQNPRTDSQVTAWYVGEREMNERFHALTSCLVPVEKNPS